MAFGKKIKGLFFEVDEESEEAQEKNDVPKKKGSEKVEVPISSSKPSGNPKIRMAVNGHL